MMYNNTHQDGNCINCASPNVEFLERNQAHCRDCDFVCLVHEHFENFKGKKYDIIPVIAPYILTDIWCTVVDVYDTFFSDNEKKMYDSFDGTIFVKFTFPQYDIIYNFKKVPFLGNVIFYFPDERSNLYSHFDKRLLLMYNSENKGMYKEVIRNNWMANVTTSIDNKFKKHRFKSIQKLEKIFSKLYENHPIPQNKGGKMN